MTWNASLELDGDCQCDYCGADIYRSFREARRLTVDVDGDSPWAGPGGKPRKVELPWDFCDDCEKSLTREDLLGALEPWRAGDSVYVVRQSHMLSSEMRPYLIGTVIRVEHSGRAIRVQLNSPVGEYDQVMMHVGGRFPQAFRTEKQAAAQAARRNR